MMAAVADFAETESKKAVIGGASRRVCYTAEANVVRRNGEVLYFVLESGKNGVKR